MSGAGEDIRVEVRGLRAFGPHGVTEAELVEAITQLAFYAGWPNAISAVAVAREVFKQK